MFDIRYINIEVIGHRFDSIITPHAGGLRGSDNFGYKDLGRAARFLLEDLSVGAF